MSENLLLMTQSTEFVKALRVFVKLGSLYDRKLKTPVNEEKLAPPP